MRELCNAALRTYTLGQVYSNHSIQHSGRGKCRVTVEAKLAVVVWQDCDILR